MEAILYELVESDTVKCNLCNHRCSIKTGRRGKCNVRENHSGKLETLVYGKVIARHIDPIEKKPIFHLSPGSLSYSISTVGCNFKCRFCQNADIAQVLPKQLSPDHNGMMPGASVSPEEIVNDAVKHNCKTIAYTYTEPTVYFEYAFETAKLAHEKGLKNIFVTNGYMTPEAIRMVSPWLDAANVDLKAYTDKFYNEQCGAKLEPVKETLMLMKSLGILVEVTTLLIPGLNDDKAELENLASFLATSVGVETPWHISRFHPTFKLTDRPPTPVKTLIAAREIGINAGLRYVYTGNVPGERSENTFCHNCNEILIERWGFNVGKNVIKNSRCPHCDAEIAGIDL